jgi:hypothetical protein
MGAVAPKQTNKQVHTHLLTYHQRYTNFTLGSVVNL